MEQLDVKFRKLCHELNLTVDVAEVYRWLVGKYNAPERHYHTTDHLDYGLDFIETIIKHMEFSESENDKINAMKFAFWFHDCMESEKASADIAEFVIFTGRRPELVGIVRELILTTSHRASSQYYLGKVIQDADLAILGSDTETFNKYETAVRKEYSKFNDEEYAVGRTKILKSFLDREHIYGTIYCRNTLESKARENISSSIRKLGEYI